MKKAGKKTNDADGSPIVLIDIEYPLVQSPIKKLGEGTNVVKLLSHSLLLHAMVRTRRSICQMSIQPQIIMEITGMIIH